ncbi:MAG TPA: type IV pilus secretin PilQ [Vicinamibacterales bacterium]|nr:type IV pilus secretin PilQ [Vicinamibacterales bacterium]
MRLTQAYGLIVALVLAGGLAGASSGESSSGVVTPAPLVRLKTITAHPTSTGTSLVIEASDPVPYVATRPDPLTLYIDFRNVSADGLASFVSNAKGPIAGVVVEPGDRANGGTPRVRISLSQPVAHRVRADRNSIVVDFDKPNAKGAPYVMPPAATPVVSPSLATGADAPSSSLALANRAAIDPITALGLNAPQRSSDAAAVLARDPSAQKVSVVRAPVLQAQNAQAQAPTLPPPTSTGQIPSSVPTTGRRFTGNPVSLDFQGADLRAVLRTFSEISSLNIVIDPSVTGTVDVALKDVPWDQALDIILRANKLGYTVDGTIVRIAPLTVLADEESQRQKLADAQALAGELRPYTKTLSYAKADDLQALLTKSVLSARGSVQVDPRTNTLIITDLPDRIQNAVDLIQALDKAQPQVEIEARIVQVNKNFQRTLGVQWGFNGRVDPQLGNTTNLAFPNSGSLTGATGATMPGGLPGAVNLPVQGATSAVGLQLGSINGAFNLDVALSALETTGNGRVLSTPRVSTQNNVEAEITQGTQIPIQTVANNTVTVQFKDAALTLKVTPQITASNTVIMKISLENGQADFTKAVNGIPPINTQRANTSVQVNDGQTTVIGGIYLSTEQYQTDRTPGLGRIPLLSWLFKRENALDNSTELLIFITPRIIKG